MGIEINALGVFLVIMGTMMLFVGNPFGWWGLAAIILAIGIFGSNAVTYNKDK
jgi:hypothetical protein